MGARSLSERRGSFQVPPPSPSSSYRFPSFRGDSGDRSRPAPSPKPQAPPRPPPDPGPALAPRLRPDPPRPHPPGPGPAPTSVLSPPRSPTPDPLKPWARGPASRIRSDPGPRPRPARTSARLRPDPGRRKGAVPGFSQIPAQPPTPTLHLPTFPSESWVLGPRGRSGDRPRTSDPVVCPAPLGLAARPARVRMGGTQEFRNAERLG